MKKLVFTVLVVLGGAMLIWTQIQAPPRVVKPIKLACDLKVDAIHASACMCKELSGVDAFYMGNIMVDVSNASGAPAASILTVTYYDLSRSSSVTVTRELSALKPYPTNPWCLQMYVVVDHPVLVKKSTGIRAEIRPASTSLFDSQPVNNVKVVNDCLQMVY